MKPPPLIPLPLHTVETTDGLGFTLDSGVAILADADSADAANWLRNQLKLQLDIEVELLCAGAGDPDSGAAESAGGPTTKGRRCIVLRLLEPSSLAAAAEDYSLRVSSGAVQLSACSPVGLLRACATLLQLLPPEPPADGGAAAQVPPLEIQDAPRFSWRGVLLDVRWTGSNGAPSRHFFKADEVLMLLDLMASLKMNMLHLHLTDDQGWRLQIRRYPRLTEVGAWRRRNGSASSSSSSNASDCGISCEDAAGAACEALEQYGGFYTQEEVRQLVAAAAARGIEVVPELEMPGHCGAALVSYPHLCCSPSSITDVSTEWGVHDAIFCAGSEDVFEFLEGVLEEVMDLFPCRYIHVGCDEVPKGQWRYCPVCQRRMWEEGLQDERQLQAYFMRRIGAFLARHGRRLVGWDEMLEGEAAGLPEGAVVMSWRGWEGGRQAARAGHDVVLAPTNRCYLDYRQAEGEPGASYAPPLTLQDVYGFDPLQPSGVTLSPEGAGTAGGGAAGAGAAGAAAKALAAAVRVESSTGCTGPPQAGTSGSGGEAAGVAASAGEGAGGESSREGGSTLQALGPEEAAHVLGGQANLWTEMVHTWRGAEQMLLPRLAAMAEVLWSAPPSPRDWPGFVRRLQAVQRHWEWRGYSFYPLP